MSEIILTVQDDQEIELTAEERAIIQAISPVVTFERVTGGAVITVEDIEGEKSVNIYDGEKGDTGITPDFSIGTITTIEPDQPASATITGTPENPVLNMSIPKGEPGSVENMYATTIQMSSSDSTKISEALADKVDKVTGKGLSANDFTDTLKSKLDGIEEGAEVNPGNATTSADGLMSATDKTKLDGIESGAQVNPGNATTSAAGLMSATDKTKLDGIESGAQVNPGNATTSADGLMSATDKTKLDGIESGATANVVSDSLTDTSTTNALSAAKGKELNDGLTSANAAIARYSIASGIGDASSYSELQTKIETVLSGMTNGETRPISSYIAISDFNSTTNYGYVTKVSSTRAIVYFSNPFKTVTYGAKDGSTWTWEKLALKNEAMDFYMSGISSSSTLTSQILAYTKANFKGRTGITVRFFLSAASAPSDIPANTNVWKYSFGEFKVRTVPGNGDPMDGMLILYGFGANNIAIKVCSNDNFASQWTILG